MRILIFNWKDLRHPAAGGAEVFTQNVAQELVRRGHAVTLFAAAVDGARATEVVEGVRVVRDGGRVGVYRSARRFWRREPAGAYDVVIDEINTRPFLTPRWIDRTPIVALIHQLAREVWYTETPWLLATLGRHVLEPWWLRAYRRVPALTVSESSARSLREHHRWTDVSVVPEGLDLDHVPDVPKADEPTVVFLGRLVGMKRPEHAIAAFELVRRRIPGARLWMVGGGPQLERLRAGAPPGVEVLGSVSRGDRASLLARAHVLVATSVREGWGLAVSEAAACGTPAIGYAVPGLVDSVPASGGHLVEARPEALATALVDFFEGRLELVPRVSTRPWPEVADAVERRLVEVVTGFREAGARARGRGA